MKLAHATHAEMPMPDVNRKLVNNGDEEWIAKYRAAVKEAPLQRKYFARLRLAAGRVRQRIVASIAKVLGKGMKVQPQTPASSARLWGSGATTVAGESPTQSRKPNRAPSIGVRPVRKSASATRRSKRTG
jgi:hypothetical protein